MSQTDAWAPGEPPAAVRSELVWLLATRLYRDHRPQLPGPDDGRCLGCGQPWPCSGRRLAELGIIRATSRSRRG